MHHMIFQLLDVIFYNTIQPVSNGTRLIRKYQEEKKGKIYIAFQHES